MTGRHDSPHRWEWGMKMLRRSIRVQGDQSSGAMMMLMMVIMMILILMMIIIM